MPNLDKNVEVVQSQRFANVKKGLQYEGLRSQSQMEKPENFAKLNDMGNNYEAVNKPLESQRHTYSQKSLPPNSPIAIPIATPQRPVASHLSTKSPVGSRNMQSPIVTGPGMLRGAPEDAWTKPQAI